MNEEYISLKRIINMELDNNTTKKLFIKCINSLYNNGVFTEKQYKENIKWIENI